MQLGEAMKYLLMLVAFAVSGCSNGDVTVLSVHEGEHLVKVESRCGLLGCNAYVVIRDDYNGSVVDEQLLRGGMDLPYDVLLFVDKIEQTDTSVQIVAHKGKLAHLEFRPMKTPNGKNVALVSAEAAVQPEAPPA